MLCISVVYLCAYHLKRVLRNCNGIWCYISEKRCHPYVEYYTKNQHVYRMVSFQCVSAS